MSAVLVHASPVSFCQLVMVVELNGNRIDRLACHRTQLADRVASNRGQTSR
jgi:hypothetical protein